MVLLQGKSVNDRSMFVMRSMLKLAGSKCNVMRASGEGEALWWMGVHLKPFKLMAKRSLTFSGLQPSGQDSFKVRDLSFNLLVIFVIFVILVNFSKSKPRQSIIIKKKTY